MARKGIPACTVDPARAWVTPAQFLPGFDYEALTGLNTWSPFDQALLIETLGTAIIATHSQAGNHRHHAVRVLKERGSLRMLNALVTSRGDARSTTRD